MANYINPATQACGEAAKIAFKQLCEGMNAIRFLDDAPDDPLGSSFYQRNDTKFDINMERAGIAIWLQDYKTDTLTPGLLNFHYEFHYGQTRCILDRLENNVSAEILAIIRERVPELFVLTNNSLGYLTRV